MASDWNILRIDRFEEAKQYFQEMGCSHFHMAREHPDRYDEYTGLQIPKDLEAEWRQETLNNLKSELIGVRGVKTDLWMLHAWAADLAETEHSAEALEAIYEATRAICDKLSPEDGLIVAETINGRRDIRHKGGLIFLAMKIRRPDIAFDFVDTSLSLSRYAKKAMVDQSRCDTAIAKCLKIQKILKT